MKEIVGQNVKVTKVTDDVFGGNHPNGINEGYNIEGTLEQADPFLLIAQENGKVFWTSTIQSTTKVDDTHYTVKTQNSTYSVEVI